MCCLLALAWASLLKLILFVQILHGVHAGDPPAASILVPAGHRKQPDPLAVYQATQRCGQLAVFAPGPVPVKVALDGRLVQAVQAPAGK
jgi:hypothetical protein